MKQAFQALVTAFIGTPRERAMHADLAHGHPFPGMEIAQRLEAEAAAPPVALAPIAHTLRQLGRAHTAMLTERDELEKEIRVMAERARQLTVSCAAMQGAIAELAVAQEINETAEEVALAAGK